MPSNADRDLPAPRRLTHLLLAALIGLAATAANAERADRDKPVNIEADRMNADDARKTAVFEGRVVLTQGTLVIRADKITVTQDRDGFQTGIATGKPATFRQKRDGSNEFVDAEAERIEYDAKADRVEFFERARMRRDGGDDVRGNYISYDARTEHFTVNSRRDAAGRELLKPGANERVQAIIQPKGANAPAPAEPAPAGRPAR
jgi:lipopolysaccharide export system protein LptA